MSLESEDLVEGFQGIFSNHPEWQEAMWVTKSEERFIQFDPGSSNLSETLRKTVNEDLKYQIWKAPVADHHTQGYVKNRIGYNTDKMNACLLNGPKTRFNLFWELANRFVDHMSNFWFHTTLDMTPLDVDLLDVPSAEDEDDEFYAETDCIRLRCRRSFRIHGYGELD